MKSFTQNHKAYRNSIVEYDGVTVCVGPPGTAKTHIACSVAIKNLLVGKVKKIVVTRPAVCAEESHGYLPGTINSKMTPYMMPIYDSFLEYITKPQLKRYMDNGDIEICPFAYMRGRTFWESFIIADEMQNATPSQMKMLLTRIGEASKMVITGDLGQSDLSLQNGLSDLVERIEKNFEKSDEMRVELVRMDQEDILRSDLVKDILKLYQT